MESREITQLPIIFPPLQLAEVPQKIINFAKKHWMKVEQIKGQRIYGPHLFIHRSWMPPQGCELFIGRLPRNMDETRLMPILEIGGPVFQLRLMMDFSGTNKGYAFVEYFQQSQAQYALQMLNNIDVSYPNQKKPHLLIFRMSVNNRRLLIGGLPLYKTLEDIYNDLAAYTEGITLVTEAHPRQMVGPKGIVFVTYQTHRLAAVARGKLLEMNYRPWGYRVIIEWAEPEVPHEEHLYQREVVYVRNVSNWTSTERLLRLACDITANGMRSFRKLTNSMILEFETRGQAETALMAMNGLILDGNMIHANWNKHWKRANNGNYSCILSQPQYLDSSMMTTVIRDITKNTNLLPIAPAPAVEVADDTHSNHSLSSTSSHSAKRSNPIPNDVSPQSSSSSNSSLTSAITSFSSLPSTEDNPIVSRNFHTAKWICQYKNPFNK